jgi:hypothetical protein
MNVHDATPKSPKKTIIFLPFFLLKYEKKNPSLKILIKILIFLIIIIIIYQFFLLTIFTLNMIYQFF